MPDRPPYSCHGHVNMISALTARPTTYKGIRMRSRLEAKVAAVLDKWDVEWLYEPRAYANVKGQYLPDFQLLAREGRAFDHLNFMEVRPTLEGAYRAMTQMAIIWDSEPDAFLIIHVPDVLDFCAPGLEHPRTWHPISRGQ